MQTGFRVEVPGRKPHMGVFGLRISLVFFVDWMWMTYIRRAHREVNYGMSPFLTLPGISGEDK